MQVVITVDTEASLAGTLEDPANRTPVLDRAVACEVDGVSEGLGFMLRELQGAGLRATFFVEAMHTRYFGAAPMGRYVDQMLAAGQDVQLHVHAGWLSFTGNGNRIGERVPDDCGRLERARLAEIFASGKQVIAGWTGTAPRALRTGSFSVSMAVFRAMRDAGLSIGSSVCASRPADDGQVPLLASGSAVIDGVTEYPVTCFHDLGLPGRGRYRQMQVTACSAREMRRLLMLAHRSGLQQVVLVTHPFEYIKSSSWDYMKIRRNRIVQQRFRSLCRFLAQNPGLFEVTTFADLPEGRVQAPRRLDGAPGLALLRAVTQVANDRIWLL